MLNSYPNFIPIFNQMPKAVAKIIGSSECPNVYGNVWFYQQSQGVLVVADIGGLPRGEGECNSSIFAFHIHEGQSCTGNDADPFADAGTHFNPNNCPHPYHAGDLPPLFSAGGFAFSAVLTNRFNLEDVIDKTIIIHSSVDDFTSQPAGNSGRKIACGKITNI